ncbi:MAG: YciI family protein [Caulobacterales bacterium]|jgi:hypothetical protein
MQVMLLLYGDEAAWAAKTPEEVAASIEPYFAYTKMLREGGYLVSGDELAPGATAKTVRLKGGVSVLDGPYADTKEQLGGYYVLKVADMDEAVRLAKLCPQANDGIVEIRPVILHDGM